MSIVLSFPLQQQQQQLQKRQQQQQQHLKANNSTHVIFRLGTIFALNIYIGVFISDIQLIRQPLFQEKFPNKLCFLDVA